MKNYLPKVLITGGNGQLASALCHHPMAQAFHLMPCSRVEMDIANITSVTHAITIFNPDIIINTAAYTAVDKAEQDREQALRVNHLGAQHLAITCKERQIPLIHISTDYVFDGTHTTPYREDDATHPANFYGKSKCLGEETVRERCEQHIILRVSGVFSEYKNNFLKTILHLAQKRKELRIVADQITCPTYAGDIAHTLFTIVQNKPQWGTYHYCNTEPVSWYQFGVAIIEAARKHQSLLVEDTKAITTAAYPTAAKRPAYSVLDCGKIEKELGIIRPSWKNALASIVPLLEGIRT
jgi:dTDP-4-dehydrorhamnose reductase